MAQGIKVDKSQFTNQLISVMQLKLIDKYESIVSKVEKDIPTSVNNYVDKRINQLESELLKVSNFDQLLFEFQDLGMSSDNPNISKGLRNIANDMVKFVKTKGPITSKEIQGYVSTWWEPAAKTILDKESVEIIKGINNLMSQANGRLQALRDIRLNSKELSEPELVNKLKKYGLSGDYLDKALSDGAFNRFDYTCILIAWPDKLKN